jgi:hypothetical protein
MSFFMKKWLKLVRWWEVYRCRHEVYAEDLALVGGNRYRCQCIRCGEYFCGDIFATGKWIRKMSSRLSGAVFFGNERGKKS